MDRDDAILAYLQNRMTSDERVRFEAQMVEDASLAGEVSVMRQVRAGMSSEGTAEVAKAGWDRLSDSIDALSRPANDNRAPWGAILRYAAVAAAAVATWQIAAVPRLSGTPETFRPTLQQAAEFVLQVKFTDSASMAEVSELLYDVQGTIIEGPGAMGVLRVAFANGDTRDAAFEVLGRADLIEIVLVQ